MIEQKKTPKEWALAKGYVVRPRPGMPTGKVVFKPQFVVADRIYRWTENAYHYQGNRFTLTENEFEDAMLKASQYPNEQPLEEALTPYARSLRDSESI